MRSVPPSSLHSASTGSHGFFIDDSALQTYLDHVAETRAPRSHS
ncbi:hypothetical protein [Pseudactinotalea sp. Z1748]